MRTPARVLAEKFRTVTEYVTGLPGAGLVGETDLLTVN